MSRFGFLSTPSARRATSRRQVLSHLRLISIHALREEGDSSPIFKKVAILNFYPRPPRGGRPGIRPALSALRYFYPRPPRGGRPAGQARLQSAKRFLSTPSARRATVIVRIGCPREEISIHALREEGDRFTVRPVKVSGVFLSTPSARRATRQAAKYRSCDKFLSTPSARRATTRCFQTFK